MHHGAKIQSTQCMTDLYKVTPFLWNSLFSGLSETSSQESCSVKMFGLFYYLFVISIIVIDSFISYFFSETSDAINILYFIYMPT